MTVSSAPPGIPSPARLEAWLGGHLGDDPGDSPGGEPAELAEIDLIAGGRSNRPPLGHVLPTAHDMSREFRVHAALTGTAVPVARPLAFCDDADVIGAPFYVMEYVPGAVIRTRQDTTGLTPGQGRDLSEALADMLAAIHGVDVSATGLASLGRSIAGSGSGTCRPPGRCPATPTWWSG
jgi:aminoglycoside phosphotransferase (APT) family kinase protein